MWVKFSGWARSRAARRPAGPAIAANDVAGGQFIAARGANVIGNLPHDFAPVSVALVAFVDQQLPQEPRADDLRRLRDTILAQHHEPDWHLADVDRPIPRTRLRVGLGLLKRLSQRADEAILAASDASASTS